MCSKTSSVKCAYERTSPLANIPQRWAALRTLRRSSVASPARRPWLAVGAAVTLTVRSVSISTLRMVEVASTERSIASTSVKRRFIAHTVARKCAPNSTNARRFARRNAGKSAPIRSVGNFAPICAPLAKSHARGMSHDYVEGMRVLKSFPQAMLPCTVPSSLRLGKWRYITKPQRMPIGSLQFLRSVCVYRAMRNARKVYPAAIPAHQVCRWIIHQEFVLTHIT